MSYAQLHGSDSGSTSGTGYTDTGKTGDELSMRSHLVTYRGESATMQAHGVTAALSQTRSGLEPETVGPVAAVVSNTPGADSSLALEAEAGHPSLGLQAGQQEEEGIACVKPQCMSDNDLNTDRFQ